jgi:cytoskeletal protein CcmA (bactofilin family)
MCQFVDMKFWTNVEKPVSTGETSAKPTPTPPVQQRESDSMVMLKRDEPSSITGAPNDLLLGRGARFEGKLSFEGTVRIDASFVGSISTNDVLVVGEHARIDAEISCGTIVIHGEVNGNVKAKTAVEIHHTGKVRGELETPSLSIEKGALFQGSVQMEPRSKGTSTKVTAVSSQAGSVDVDTIAAAARASDARPTSAATK